MTGHALPAPRSTRAARGVAVAALSAIALAVLFAWLRPSHDPLPAGVGAAFCALAPPEAHAGDTDRADVQFAARVPVAPPEVGTIPTPGASALQGNVVRVAVNSPREGGIAVHGLLDVHPIAAGERITVQFRAIYSGRFPVHFHGADGSHIEIAAIEVLPPGVTR